MTGPYSQGGYLAPAAPSTVFQSLTITDAGTCEAGHRLYRLGASRVREHIISRADMPHWHEIMGCQQRVEREDSVATFHEKIARDIAVDAIRDITEAEISERYASEYGLSFAEIEEIKEHSRQIALTLEMGEL